jgi:hypothetical protein
MVSMKNPAAWKFGFAHSPVSMPPNPGTQLRAPAGGFMIRAC